MPTGDVRVPLSEGAQNQAVVARDRRVSRFAKRLCQRLHVCYFDSEVVAVQ